MTIKGFPEVTLGEEGQSDRKRTILDFLRILLEKVLKNMMQLLILLTVKDMLWEDLEQI